MNETRVKLLFENEQIRRFLHRHGLATDGGVPLRKEEIEQRLRQIDEESSVDLIAQSLIEKALNIKRPLRRSSRNTEQNLPITIYDNSCAITMIYSGSDTSSNEKIHSFQVQSDEVMIMQYQTNTSSIIVYKSYLKPHDELTFKSHRLLDKPFTIAIYVNGIVDSRISTCCERGFLKQRHSHSKRSLFQLLTVSGGTPCYTCQANEMMDLSRSGDFHPEPQSDLISMINSDSKTAVRRYPVMSIVSEPLLRMKSRGSSSTKSDLKEICSKLIEKQLSVTESSSKFSDTMNQMIKHNESDHAEMKIGYEKDENRSLSSLANHEMQQLLSSYLSLLVPSSRSPLSTRTIISQQSTGIDHLSSSHNRENLLLIWLNLSADASDMLIDLQIKLRTMFGSLLISRSIDQTNHFIQNFKREKVFLIISGATSDWNQIDTSRIYSIYLLNYVGFIPEKMSKICGSFTNINALYDNLREDLKQIFNTHLPISVTSNSAFLCGQLHRELMLTIEHPDDALANFTDYCRDIYKDNEIELRFLETFQSEYQADKAIWWYTRPHCLREMLNIALFRQEISMLYHLQFFIKDLHMQLERLYQINETSFQSRVFTVYRGMHVSKNAFNETIQQNVNKLLAFDAFLATNLNKKEALRCMKMETNPEDVLILFQIEIDTEKFKYPFADISCLSAVQSRDEILFSLGTIFRIDRVAEEKTEEKLWIVYLTSVDEDDEQLQNPMKQIHVTLLNFFKRVHQAQMTHHDQRKLITSYTNMAKIYYKQDQYEKSLNLYRRALNNAAEMPNISPRTIAKYNEHIAKIYIAVGQVDDALLVYERALKTRLQQCEMNDLDLVYTLQAMGDVYHEKREFSKALKFYHKALEVQPMSKETVRKDDRSSIAATHIRIALNYHEQNKIHRALSHFLKAIEYQHQSFSKYHPILAFPYNYVSVSYHQLKKYELALKYQFLVLDVEKHILPKDHSNLSSTYANIAIVYEQLQNYEQAIVYAEKALRQVKLHFSDEHSDVQTKQTHLDKLLSMSKD